MGDTPAMKAERATSAFERQEVFFAGRVQGVGFRYTTRQLAARFAVLGYVQNLPDGRVKLVVEGTAVEIAGLRDAIAAERGRHITSRSETKLPATGEFEEFSIRH